MPYQVSQLLKNVGKPVTAGANEPIRDALDRMLQYGFSQLPVVKGEDQQRQFYFITHESILLALHNFGSRIDTSGLRVDDALVKVSGVYRATDDLFQLLAGMREMNAAVIVDDERNLTNVVTSYDTSHYFRQWAEDIMQVRDIEHGLKRIVNGAFKNADGEIDENARQSAVEELTSSNKALRKKFALAVHRYLTPKPVIEVALKAEWADLAFAELIGATGGSEKILANVGNGANCGGEPAVQSGESPGWAQDKEDSVAAARELELTRLLSAGVTLRGYLETAIRAYLQQQSKAAVSAADEALLDEAFKILYDRNEQIKEFGELTLGDYIQLFFKAGCWGRCREAIKVTEDEVRHMFEGVRDSRNDLAHFREDAITTQRRLQLRRCADWLSEREKLIIAAFDATSPGIGPAN